jgi:nitrile hydratase
VNGIHDMGGMHGMGPIAREADEPVFHHAWERRVFALRLAASALGCWNLDASRHAGERMPPARYLAASYYQRWLYSLEELLVAHGLLSRAEIAGGVAASGSARTPRQALPAEAVDVMVRYPGGARVAAPVAARFALGDAVVARNVHPVGHTRLPRYARGRRGVIERDHGVFVFPDTHASGVGEQPQHVYSVRFAARELWGPDAPPRDAVYVDLWDDYLDPV